MRLLDMKFWCMSLLQATQAVVMAIFSHWQSSPMASHWSVTLTSSIRNAVGLCELSSSSNSLNCSGVGCSMPALNIRWHLGSNILNLPSILIVFPPSFKELEEKESPCKPTALRMDDVDVTGQCKAMGEECQWEQIAVTTACVACNSVMHVMCGVKFDDGEGLEDEACYKCHNCNDVKAC